MMRVKVTTQADADLQKLFLAAVSVHGKTFAEALDIGMRVILKDIDPCAVIDSDIARKASELEELHKLRAEMRVLEPAQKRLKQFTLDAAALEELREKLFQEKRSWLVKDIRRGDVNWNTVLWDFQFQNRQEAVAWFRQRIEREKTDTSTGVKT